MVLHLPVCKIKSFYMEFEFEIDEEYSNAVNARCFVLLLRTFLFNFCLRFLLVYYCL